MDIWIAAVIAASAGLGLIGHLLRQSWLDVRHDRTVREEQAERTETIIRRRS